MADFEFGESRAIGFVSRTWFGGIKNARHFLWSRILKCCQTWESDSRFEGCQHITLFDHRSMYVHHPSMAHLEKSRPKSTAKQYSINNCRLVLKTHAIAIKSVLPAGDLQCLQCRNRAKNRPLAFSRHQVFGSQIDF